MTNKPLMVPIEKIIKETDDTRTFRVKYKSDHMPGQFVEVSVLGIGECPISISSYDHSYMDLCIRKVGTVTSRIFELKEKEKVGIRGPYGNGYPMADFEYKPLIIIGGGTGVAPLRGVIHYVEKHKDRFLNTQMFFGFRTKEDMLFKRELSRLDAKITVDKRTKTWKGNVGVITDLLAKSKLDTQSNVVICGPPVMIRFVIKYLLEKGFTKEQIWLSLERKMKCGVGKCGYCQIGPYYVCKDGPVFNYKTIEGIQE
ncbi:MAG: FAD/NAD(P)-binding protein [Candidatus Woesearchaeota archaeon]